jgi:hypothetical protein
MIVSLFPSTCHCSVFCILSFFHSQERNMAEVRQRAKAADPTIAPSEPPSAKPTKKSSGFGLTDVLRILGGILLLNCALSYFVTSSSLTWGWRPWYSKPSVVATWLVRLPLQPHYPSKSHPSLTQSATNRKDQSTSPTKNSPATMAKTPANQCISL